MVEPQEGPTRRLNGKYLRHIRTTLAETPTELAQELGLIDVLFYLNWENGVFDEAGLAYQLRILRDVYLDWVAANWDLLFLPEVAPPLPPCPAQWPPRAQPFVRRLDALGSIEQWQADCPPTPRVFVVRGSSGSGKTALLADLLHSHHGAARPFGILFWNFSTNPRIEEFLDAALSYFAPDRTAPANLSVERLMDWLEWRDPRDHLLVLDGLEAVQDRPGGTPGAITDPSVRKLLTRICAGLGGTRAVIASCLPFPQLEGEASARTLDLAGFSRDEAQDLLMRLGLPDRPAADDLIDAFGTHPLTLRILAGLASELRKQPRDLVWSATVAVCEPGREEASAEPLRAVLGQDERYLSELERDLMRVLSALPHETSLTTLLDVARATPCLGGALAGADPETIGSALQRLERLALVSCTQGTRYRLHAAIRSWWREQPPDWGDAAASPADARQGAFGGWSAGQAAANWRWQLALLSLGRGNAQARKLLAIFKRRRAGAPDPGGDCSEAAPGTLDELRRILAALGIVPAHPDRPMNLWEGALRTGGAPAPGLDDAGVRQLVGLFESAVETDHADLAFEIYQGYLGGYAEVGHRRGWMVLGERLLRRLAGVGEGQDRVGLPPSLTPAQQFRVAFDWGLFRGARGGVVGEIQCYRAALAQAAESPLGQAVAWRALAYAERQRGHLGQALIACDWSLDGATAAGLADQQVFSGCLRASLLHDLGRVPEAQAAFADQRTALERDRLAAASGIWQTEQECDLGRLATCLELGRDVLGDCEALRDKGLVARCHLNLGLSLVKQDPGGAERHLKQAQGWIDDSDHTELRLRAQELRSWIAGVRQLTILPTRCTTIATDRTSFSTASMTRIHANT